MANKDPYSTKQAAVTVEALKETTDKNFKTINYILYAIGTVLVVAVVSLLITVQGLVITYQHDTTEAYREYRQEVSDALKEMKALNSMRP